MDKPKLVQSKHLPLALIDPNKGQIDGLPKNPRLIRDKNFKKLKQSIEENPEMTALREILVYPQGDRFVIIGGNMRYEAMKSLGLETAPCKIIPADTPVEKLRQIVIKDNSGFGEWDFDLLANDWDKDLINACCIEIPDLDKIQTEEEQAEDDNFDPTEAMPKSEPITKAGDIWKLGDHRLICGDSTKAETIDALMGDDLADCIIADPPYNVNYSSKNKALNTADKGNRVQKAIANDNMAEPQFYEFLLAAFTAANRHLKAGGAFYIWHSDVHGLTFRNAVCDTGWQLRETLIWNKNSLILGRQDWQWKHEPCQPAGTMVSTPSGAVPIEQLKDGDVVLTFDKASGAIKGYKNGGYEVKTASRHYEGEMYTIHVGDRKTQSTDNHQFSIRFNASAKKNYCTYLMQRGDRWRVGIARCYDARQFGMKTRFNQERAERMWLLGIYADKIEAQVAEQIVAVKYGIPYTIWETDRFTSEQRTKEQIAQIYASIDTERMNAGAIQCLHDHGRNEKYPFIDTTSKADKFSTRVTAKVRACNIVPEIMQVPTPKDTAKRGENNFEWSTITATEHRPFAGQVYSLAVKTHQHYIADGIVTHNCLYGWKDGASHYFSPRRDLTTVIDALQAIDIDSLGKDELRKVLHLIMDADLPTTIIDCNKPLRSAEHPTMKPIPLIALQMKNSTRKREIVLDMFGGSGTTMMAAEQLGRHCRMVEFDPAYCDVIVNRWEKLTGRQAERIGNIADTTKTAETEANTTTN